MCIRDRYRFIAVAACPRDDLPERATRSGRSSRGQAATAMKRYGVSHRRAQPALRQTITRAKKVRNLTADVGGSITERAQIWTHLLRRLNERRDAHPCGLVLVCQPARLRACRSAKADRPVGPELAKLTGVHVAPGARRRCAVNRRAPPPAPHGGRSPQPLPRSARRRGNRARSG